MGCEDGFSSFWQFSRPVEPQLMENKLYAKLTMDGGHQGKSYQIIQWPYIFD